MTATLVPLRTLPENAEFHIPTIGRKGRVRYHGPGSSAVTVMRVVVREVTRKDKKTEATRTVQTRREEWEDTVWSLNTMVVPGPAPEDMRLAGDDEQGNPVGRVQLADNPFLADDDDVVETPAPAPAVRKHVFSEATKQMLRAPTWPVRVAVPAGVAACKPAGGKKTYRQLLDKVPGLRIAEEKKAGAGSTLFYEAADGTALATLLDNLDNIDGRRTLRRTLTQLALAGVDVKVLSGKHSVRVS